MLDRGETPPRLDVSVLFAPTGPGITIRLRVMAPFEESSREIVFGALPAALGIQLDETAALASTRRNVDGICSAQKRVPPRLSFPPVTPRQAFSTCRCYSGLDLTGRHCRAATMAFQVAHGDAPSDCVPNAQRKKPVKMHHDPAEGRGAF
jgi:hypothetical protein